MELIQTKLAPPFEPQKLLTRPRLQSLLKDITNAKLTLVQTPAGYGKTSLLWQWYQSLRDEQYKVGWINIDASDHDPSGTLAYVAAAFENACDEFADSAGRLLHNERYFTPDLMLNALVNALTQVTTPVYLFLDDLHLAEATTLASIERLIDLAPRTTHFVVASRELPNFPLAKIRARGDLVELGVDDLVFTEGEAERFMENAGHGTLQEEDLKMLESCTEGWITGIKLASLAWNGDVSAQHFLSAFTGTRRSVADFFAEEVLAAQTPEVQSFLLSTSVLDRLTPALCNAVTKTDDARVILDQIEASGLFLLKLDEDRVWYRYHHLFAQFLRRLLYDRDPDAERLICSRASEWFYESGQHIKAVEYALKADDFEQAAQILEIRCQDMAYKGRIRLVAQFAKQIPMNVLKYYPTVLLTWTWLLTYNLRFEESHKLLDVVRSRLQKMDEEADTALTRHLHGLLLHREMSLAAAQDDAHKVEELCELLLREFQDEIHPYLQGTIYSLLLYAQRDQYKLANLDALAAKAQGVTERSGYPLSHIVYHANVGPSLFFAGKVDAAQRVLEEGVAEASRQGGSSYALVALPALPLCEILYERNDLDQAQKLLSDTLPMATVFGFVDQIMAGHLTQARIHAARGQLDEAHQVLDVGMKVALDRNLDRLRMALINERVRLLLQHAGSPEQATQYARAAGIPGSPEHMLPGGRTRTTTEAQAMAWVRIAQKQDRLTEALHLAKRWRSFSAAHGAMLSLIRWNILVAQIQLLGGDTRSAQRTLREAVAKAAPIRITRSFLDEGTIVQTLLESSAEVEPHATHPTDLFAAELLAHFSPQDHKPSSIVIDQPPAEGLYGKLTAKELEILSLVGGGMRNAEIALKLGMTEGSIKWYLQQIYDKMGTRRRLQAVERGRQLGLLV